MARHTRECVRYLDLLICLLLGITTLCDLPLPNLLSLLFGKHGVAAHHLRKGPLGVTSPHREDPRHSGNVGLK